LLKALRKIAVTRFCEIGGDLGELIQRRLQVFDDFSG
jgi:hypothetical protein